MENPRTCAKCGKSQTSINSGSLTQWISLCNCASLSGDDSIAAILMCGKCHRRIESTRQGSFTQWIFKENRCDCRTPEPISATIAVERPAPARALHDDLAAISSPSSEEQELGVNPEQFPIERYKPLQLVGSGAAGDVYLCRDRLLGKRVAVKTLRQITAEQLMSFQQEARATSSLKHPGVVRVLDFGATKSGAPFMVMDFVEGINLERYLEENGALPVPLVIHLMELLCGALAYTHANGIYHRDLKPSNIILIELAGGGFDLRLIDFGIARVKEITQEPTIHQGITIAGTPAYMSPDQIAGKPFDARSEIYSLGCLFFQCLTGRPPFSGETGLETLTMHASQEPPSLSEAAGEDRFPDWLEGVIAGCLQKDPARRFKDVRELLGAIASGGAERDSEPEHVFNDSSNQIQSNQAGFRSKLALPAILTLLLLLAATTFFMTSANKQPEEKESSTNRVVVPHFAREKPLLSANNSLIDPNLMPLPGKDQLLIEKTINGQNWLYAAWPLSDSDLQELEGKPAERLQLQHCVLDGSGLKYLKNSHVRMLVLDDNGSLQNECFDYINALEDLECLSFAKTNVSFDGLRRLNALNKLRMLDCRDCPHIDDSCIAFVSRWPQLTDLRIGGCEQLTSGAIWFLPAFKRLTNLDINGMNVSPSQLQILRNTPISQLNIDRCQLTDATFLELKDLKSLSKLTAYETPVSKQAVVKLQAALPHCDIRYSRANGSNSRYKLIEEMQNDASDFGEKSFAR